MGTSKAVDGFNIQNGAGRSIKTADIYYSNDGINFTLQGSYTIQKIGSKQNFDFPSALIFKYFKIVPTSSWHGQPYAQIAEISFYNN